MSARLTSLMFVLYLHYATMKLRCSGIECIYYTDRFKENVEIAIKYE